MTNVELALACMSCANLLETEASLHCSTVIST